MNRWENKIAVCTGASAGIGASTTIDLIKSGMIVVALARRKEKIEELRSKLSDGLKKNLYAVKCDVSNENEIIETFKWIDKNLGGISVLINNAGILRKATLLEQNNSVPIREVIETNVFGLLNCTREAYLSMKKYSIDGHIININSLVGHKIPIFVGQLPSFNIYPASKYAVTAINEVLRQDLIDAKSKIKITVSILKFKYCLLYNNNNYN